MKEIRDIIQAYKAAEKAGLRAALATVVQVEGSSYRRPGARMLVTEDGMITGAISGGCLEGDALRKALLVIQQQQNKLVTYDTTDDDDLTFGIQLGCNGIVHILFEPIDASSPFHAIALLEKALVHRSASVVATLFSVARYNSPQPGTCLVYQHNQFVSNITDATLLAAISSDVHAGLTNKSSALYEYHFDESQVTGLIEYLPPVIALIIAGAGNDVLPLVYAARQLGWDITVADGRPAQASPLRFPHVQQLLTGNPAAVAEKLRFDERTALVLMTHNYNYDRDLLQLIAHKPCPYIGLLGPAKKLERMLDELLANGVAIDDSLLQRMHGPTGLDIGAETAEEIAISVIAEIKMVMEGKNGQSLKEKKGAIHSSGY